MKMKVADTVFTLTCLTMCGIAVATYVIRTRPTAARETVVTDLHRYPQAASQDHTYTVVVYIDPDCRFCSESLPFYRRMSTAATAATSDAALRFRSNALPSSVERYLVSAGIERPVIASEAIPDEVRATPTIVVFDRAGRAVASWQGRLNRRQERLLLAYFREPRAGGQSDR